MNLKVKLGVLAMMLFVLFFQPATGSASAHVKATGQIFEGCWTYWPSGPCRAIFKDSGGNYSICGNCDSFGNPGSGTCSPIAEETLQIGYWCS